MEEKILLLSTVDALEKFFEKHIGSRPKVVDNDANRKRLTRAQAAKFCSMSYHTFGVHVRAGRFIERGIGRKKFFYQDELIRALNQERK